MYSIRPLQTLADFQEAKSAAHINYNHSLAKMVPNKKAIRKSTKIAITRKSKQVTKKQTSASTCRSKSKETVDEERKTPDQVVQLFIRNPVRETLCLQLHPSTCISDIKDSLRDKLGIQTETQHLLTKKGFELCNNQSLRVLGIQQDTNLELCLVPGLMGGASNQKTAKDSQRSKPNNGTSQEPNGENTKMLDVGGKSHRTIPGKKPMQSESVMSELSYSVKHLSISSPPLEKTNKKRRKRNRKKTKHKERTEQKAFEDEGQDAHLSKDASSAAGCMSEGHLQEADSPRCSNIPLQDAHRIASACADINIEPGHLPNYATGAIPKKRRKRMPRKKSKHKERTEQKAFEDEGQDAHLSKDASSAAGCMSEGHLQEADSPRCSNTPLQDEPRTASACADINIEPGHLPNYATGAIPKKKSCKQKHTKGLDQGPPNDGVQSPGASAAGKSHEEQNESKTMVIRSELPFYEELEAHPTGSEVDLIQLQRDLSSTTTIQGGLQKAAVYVKGSNNVTSIDNRSVTIYHAIGQTAESGERNMTETTALDTRPNNDATKAADQCEAELKRKYMTTGRYVQTLPGVEDEKRDIKEIYTNLQWTHGKMQSCGYTFLTTWELGPTPTRIVIAGTAGLGKSTLLCKIAYDWATGVETLAKYKLVFLLKMHSLDETSQLIDAIVVQLLDHDTHIKPSDLKAFISDKPHKVLILLDGFNELLTSNLYDDNSGSILQLLNRKIGRECYVVTTTRPSHMKELVHESLIQKPYTRIDVLGFAAKDIENYIIGYFREKHDKAQDLLLRINSQDVLYDMAKTPMFLLLMCLLWGENNELPDTMSSIYKTVMQNLFQRKPKKVTSESISEVLTKIGEIALHGLLEPKLMTSFQENDFESSVLEAAMKAGVFTSKEVIKEAHAHTRIEFLHRTIHEYCAALYIQSLTSNPVKFKETIQQIKSLTKDNPISFEYLFRFCCVNAECMKAVFQILHDFQDHKLALQCYFESQSDELPPPDFINSVITENITISCWNSDCIKSFMYFLKKVADQKKVKENIYLQKVQALKMIMCNLFNFSHCLAFCIDKMASITVLHLTGCSLTSSTMKLIAESLGKSHLVELDLSWNDGLRDSIELWFSSFQGVKKLVLRSCALTGNDIKHIAVSQRKIPTIVELVLTKNESAFASVESVLLFCNDLVCLSCLESLSLECCSLTGESFKCLSTALGKIPALTELCLFNNAKLGGSAGLWSLCLKEIEHLKKLDFRHCSLKADDVSQILSSGMLSLLCLKLSGNRSLGGNTNSWYSQIRSLTHIEELELKDCNMDRNDFTCLVSLIGSLRRHIQCFFEFQGVQHFLVITGLSSGVRLDLSECCLSAKMLIDVLEAISNKNYIVELALGENEELGGNAIEWSRYITDLMKLQHLDLRHCKVSSGDIEALAISLSVISTLVELNLSENEALGGCAAEWANHLAQLQHMKKLYLSKCSLRSRDIKDMALSFCDVHSLLELDLSINGLLRDTRELWDYFKCLKQLQKLDLSWCSLTNEDAKQISKTMGRLNLHAKCENMVWAHSAPLPPFYNLI